MIDAEIVAELKNFATHLDLKDQDYLAKCVRRGVTLAERYLYVRENPSVTHYEHERHGTVGRVGEALDAAVDAARKGGGE